MRAVGTHILITGGSGFIGTNLAHRLAEDGHHVLIYDNLARPGVERNLAWLRQKHPDKIEARIEDVRDMSALRKAVHGAEAVFHLAAQVAVTTSLVDPILDFEVNARGTLNLLEAIRARRNPPPLVFTSTNKVLGGLDHLELADSSGRYEPRDERIRACGISEKWGIDFCSPYGCSKGAADQYVLDYSRCFGIPAVVFRMSCIYGPHQCGTEDQGWVAHFVKQAIAGMPITFYGDGKQVRDALFVEDLVDAFLRAWKMMPHVKGHAFNIGGGPTNTTSLIELVDLIAKLHGRRPDVHREDWRPSDQRYYVSDTRKFGAATGWISRVSLQEGVARLYEWLERSSHASQPGLQREVACHGRELRIGS